MYAIPFGRLSLVWIGSGKDDRILLRTLNNQSGIFTNSESMIVPAINIGKYYLNACFYDQGNGFLVIIYRYLFNPPSIIVCYGVGAAFKSPYCVFGDVTHHMRAFPGSSSRLSNRSRHHKSRSEHYCNDENHL